ncbi:MAG: acetate--CoA ligase family protein [Candidatus Omnitrophica bacterium]|nr:acetate--CoA ligase family protein [Candidatus Omnitrophota bacterium]MDE2231576.1 acetate--CoA ligase family protein [Candidatus Omnitrophota bacterium]
MPVKNLDRAFNPKRVAVIGASSDPSKIGHQVIKNIIEGGYQGEIIPVNPKADVILGVKAYKSLNDVPEGVDLVIIAIPAPLVVGAMEECARRKVGAVAVITSGFAEVGKTQEELKLKKIADDHDIALFGPNIFGLAYPPEKLNASFGPKDIYPGKIAFITQSGALGIGLMGWTAMKKIGLAALVSIGNKADIDETDLIEYFNKDENVNVQLLYMEGVKNGPKFLQTKIEKPTVVLKVGRSTRGAQAAASHTGSLSGSDKIYDGAFKQIGLLRASTFIEAFSWARALSQPLPKGEDTLIITNGGGIGVATTDECEAQGIKILDDPAWLEAKFRPTMPDYGSTKNPIDVTGGAGVDGYRKALKIAFAEDRVKSIIVLYCETAVTDPMDIAVAVNEAFEGAGRNKPVVVAMVGGERTREALVYLNEKLIPASSLVDISVSALSIIYSWAQIKARGRSRLVLEKPPAQVNKIMDAAQAQGRKILMEHEARQVMELCGVPTPKWGFARSGDEAVRIAESKQMYPLAMKIASPDIVHKSDVGGVVLNIRDGKELKDRYEAMMARIKKDCPKADLQGVNLIQMVSGIECIVGISTDPQFGPAVMFGLGGVFVEALKDVTFRVVPFDADEAGRMISEIKAKKILDGFRGMKAHKDSIIKTLVAVQKLSPLVKEIDINPLLTNHNGSYAVDARIVLK